MKAEIINEDTIIEDTQNAEPLKICVMPKTICLHEKHRIPPPSWTIYTKYCLDCGEDISSLCLI